MQDISDDDEFYDAVGSVGQIEEIKAQLEQTRLSNVQQQAKPRIATDLSSVKTQSGFHSASLTQKKSFPEENENTLTMSEREANHIRETQDKNLQQILDKLDENSAYISAEIGMKSKDGSQDKAEDSPSKIKGRGKSESNSDNSKSLSPKSSARSKNSLSGSPNKFNRSANAQKRSFFSVINRKRSNDPEFTKESVKLHNRNSSNFEKLLCLQTIEDEKKQQQTQQLNQEATPTSKKAKASAATWIAKFSPNNKYLATGGSEGLLKVYSMTIMEDGEMDQDSLETNLQVIDSNFTTLVGHKHDIIDISWFKTSKYIITSAIDKMVILWNVEEKCLVKIFEHSDIVSCLSFHPLVDEFFATGCFDKMIRIWDINETKVVDWVQTGDLITALTFSPDKNHLLVGFYKGTVKIYRTDQGKLKFTMEIVCKNSFAWGKLNKVGKKVTGIIFTEDYEFLVMTNDSRMRLVDMNTYETKMKYKGHTSGKYHIQPSYNYEKELILSGSEDEKVYVWNKISDYVPQLNPIYSFQKANRNTSYEVFKPFPKANTTCAIWVPFQAVKKYREKVLSVWKDIYVDSMMILFSSESRIKVVGNLIELDSTQDKKSK